MIEKWSNIKVWRVLRAAKPNGKLTNPFILKISFEILFSFLSFEWFDKILKSNNSSESSWKAFSYL